MLRHKPRRPRQRILPRKKQRPPRNWPIASPRCRLSWPRLRPSRRPPKQPLRGGREVDAIFDSTPFLKDLIGAKLGKQKLEKAMRLDDEPSFERAWLAYAQRSINPATGRNFTEREAKDFNAREGVRAFQDEDRGEVHIRKERADLGTQLHEGLHLFSEIIILASDSNTRRPRLVHLRHHH